MNMGPRIVRSGLVLNLDAAQKTSYSGSGNTWNDLSGNRNNATLVNEIVFNSNNGGNFLVDGVNDYISINPINASSQFTLNFTIKPIGPGTTGSTSYGGIINKFNGVSAQQNRLLIDSSSGGVFNKYLFQVVKGGVVTNIFSNTFNSIKNQITFVSLTYDGNNVNFYNNAINVGTTAFSGTLDSGASNPTIGWGANSADYYFNGYIYNVIMYNRGLSISEILQNYNATKGRFGL